MRAILAAAIVVALCLTACASRRDLLGEAIAIDDVRIEMQPEDLLRYVPADSIHGFHSFTITAGHRYLGDAVSDSLYESDVLPTDGVLFIDLIGMRSDTIYDIGLVFKDRHLQSFHKQAESTFTYDEEGILRHGWILGRLYSKYWKPSCLHIIAERYEPFLADTASLGLYDILATVEDRDTVEVCREGR